MLFRPPKPVAMTLNLAPMVDVMMCLIIFFLLASKLVVAQHSPLNLPHARAAREVDAGQLGQRVVISVRPAADDPLRAEYVVQRWDGQMISEETLAPQRVADYLRARARLAAERREELRCVIRADKRVTYGHVEMVLRGCGLAKIAKVIFSARPGEEPEEQG